MKAALLQGLNRAFGVESWGCEKVHIFEKEILMKLYQGGLATGTPAYTIL